MRPKHLQRKRINAAMNHVIAHPEQEHSLGELASLAHYSPYHFLRTFKAVTHQTPLQFVLSQRLDRAARLLIYNTRLSVTEVSAACGFASSQHFSSVFKPAFGITPREIRGNLRFLNERTWPPLLRKSDVDSPAPTDPGLDECGVGIKLLPAYRVSYLRTIGPYDFQTLDWCFEYMRHWLNSNVPNPMMFGVPRSIPGITPPWRCLHDVCGVLPQGLEPAATMSQQILDGGLTAIYRSEVSNKNLYFNCRRIWTWLTNEWFPASQYQPDDRPSFEIYLQGPTKNPRGNLLMEFCVPVRPLDASIHIPITVPQRHLM